MVSSSVACSRCPSLRVETRVGPCLPRVMAECAECAECAPAVGTAHTVKSSSAAEAHDGELECSLLALPELAR